MAFFFVESITLHVMARRRIKDLLSEMMLKKSEMMLKKAAMGWNDISRPYGRLFYPTECKIGDENSS